LPVAFSSLFQFGLEPDAVSQIRDSFIDIKTDFIEGLRPLADRGHSMKQLSAPGSPAVAAARAAAATGVKSEPTSSAVGPSSQPASSSSSSTTKPFPGEISAEWLDRRTTNLLFDERILPESGDVAAASADSLLTGAQPQHKTLKILNLAYCTVVKEEDESGEGVGADGSSSSATAEQQPKKKSGITDLFRRLMGFRPRAPAPEPEAPAPVRTTLHRCLGMFRETLLEVQLSFIVGLTELSALTLCENLASVKVLACYSLHENCYLALAKLKRLLSIRVSQCKMSAYAREKLKVPSALVPSLQDFEADELESQLPVEVFDEDEAHQALGHAHAQHMAQPHGEDEDEMPELGSDEEDQVD
jgi:hypothetical protein